MDIRFDIRYFRDRLLIYLSVKNEQYKTNSPKVILV